MRLQPRLSSSLIMLTVYTTQGGTLCISSEFPEFGRALSSLPSIRDCFNAVPTQVYIMILPKRRTNIQPCMCIIYVYLCVYVYMNTYILRLIHTITTTGKSKIYIYYLSSAFFFFVLVLVDTNLDISGNRESQWRKCLHQICL